MEGLVGSLNYLKENGVLLLDGVLQPVGIIQGVVLGNHQFNQISTPNKVPATQPTLCTTLQSHLYKVILCFC